MTDATKTTPIVRNPVFYGMDSARGEDKSVECEFERLPDGTIKLKSLGEVIEGKCHEVR